MRRTAGVAAHVDHVLCHVFDTSANCPSIYRCFVKLTRANCVCGLHSGNIVIFVGTNPAYFVYEPVHVRSQKTMAMLKEWESRPIRSQNSVRRPRFVRSLSIINVRQTGINRQIQNGYRYRCLVGLDTPAFAEIQESVPQVKGSPRHREPDGIYDDGNNV